MSVFISAGNSGRIQRYPDASVTSRAREGGAPASDVDSVSTAPDASIESDAGPSIDKSTALFVEKDDGPQIHPLVDLYNKCVDEFVYLTLKGAALVGALVLIRRYDLHGAAFNVLKERMRTSLERLGIVEAPEQAERDPARIDMRALMEDSFRGGYSIEERAEEIDFERRSSLSERAERIARLVNFAEYQLKDKAAFSDLSVTQRIALADAITLGERIPPMPGIGSYDETKTEMVGNHMRMHVDGLGAFFVNQADTDAKSIGRFVVELETVSRAFEKTGMDRALADSIAADSILKHHMSTGFEQATALHNLERFKPAPVRLGMERDGAARESRNRIRERTVKFRSRVGRFKARGI